MIHFQCDCSMGHHKAPLEGYDISSGAINNIPEILKDYSKVYMVADTNTYAAAGEAVEKILKVAGKHYRTYVIDGEVILPNTETLGKIILNAADPTAKPNIFAYSDLPEPGKIRIGGRVDGTAAQQLKLAPIGFDEAEAGDAISGVNTENPH